MTNRIADPSPFKTARMAGFLYLIFIVTFASSTFVQSNPVVSGDAAATARNILAHAWLFRIGFIGELVSAVFFLLAAWALYVLLKPVNKNLALLFVFFLLGGVVIECVHSLNHFASQLLLSDADYLKVFRSDQLQALSMFFLNLGYKGQTIAGLFYAIWLFPLGYLVLRSGFLPKILGILPILDGFCLLICFFQIFLLPGYERMTYPLYPVMFIAEFGLTLWLLIKGVRHQPLDAPA